MKKSVVALLLVATLLFAQTAFALPSSPESTMVIDAGTEHLYIGEGNEVYTSASADALVPFEVKSLLYADRVKVLFTTVDGTNSNDVAEPGILYSIANSDNEPDPHTIAMTATDCVYIPKDSAIYYVDQENLNKLMAYDILEGSYREALDCGGAIQQLRQSVDGLVVAMDEGDKLYSPLSKELMVWNVPDAAATLVVGDHFETRLNADGTLQLRAINQEPGQRTAIDDNVSAATLLDNVVFYLKTENGESVLMEYDYAAKHSTTIGRFKSAMQPVMAAENGNVYLVAADGRIFKMDVMSHTVDLFDHLPENVHAPVLAATDDKLLLYESAGYEGMNTFVQSFDLEPEAAVIEPEADPTPKPTRAPVNPPMPAAEEPMLLTKGSRGEDVREVQQLLIDHNYPITSADGIYGARTFDAVQYLQYDMGVSETGNVTESFLNKMRRDMPDYERFVSMERGDNGIRVYDLQVKLHALEWLSAAANGNYGPQTEEAIKNLQTTIGHSRTGVADVKTLKALWAKDAPHNPDAQPQTTPDPHPTKKPHAPKPTPKPKAHQDPTVSTADINYLVDWLITRFDKDYSKSSAVYKLQKKLYQCGYLKKSHITKKYDQNTLIAMKHYQNDGDFMAHPTGLPNDSTLSRMFPNEAMLSTMND